MIDGTAIKICHGKFAQTLIQTLNEKKLKRILVVCGKNSFSASGAKDKLIELEPSFNVTYFSGFSENPTVEEAERAFEVCTQIEADAVVAIGGGSAIDIAKLAVGLSMSQVTMDSLLEGHFSLKGHSPYLIAVPTTSGSGSESTHFAVVYKGSSKYSIANSALLPKVVLLDGCLTVSMSKKQAACSGLDAFCQAVESLWSKSATDESKSYALTALEMLNDCLIRSVNENDLTARKKCIEAANFAGRAINITKTTAPHAYSYHLTKEYGLPHGLAVALSMAVVLRASLSLSDYYDGQLEQLYSILSINNVEELICYLDVMLHTFELPKTLAEIGCIDESQIDAYLLSVNAERLGNHPVKIDAESMQNIIVKGL